MRFGGCARSQPFFDGEWTTDLKGDEVDINERGYKEDDREEG